ncbi:MAG: carbamoyltransferase [Candidatus Eisenbacteria sp.]|nr:carbamoyltransferase [Candidatus Eisenbacteria bacterium]
MNILGISCFYHDSAACLVRDGDIVGAAQEERFTRKKHDSSFPSGAIAYCLREGGITSGALDLVVFYEKPLVKFERILETHIARAPVGLASFLTAMPLWITQKLWIPDLIRKNLDDYDGKIIYPEHHESHAASAFFPSPFREAAFLTLDAVGEWTTSSYGVGSGNRIEILAEQRFPHSLGMLYSAFTYYTGFRVNSGEYKVMGLAPYGEPKYARMILDHLVDLKEDGSFRLNMDYFGYRAGLRMTNRKFEKLFGGAARKPESEITQREMDLAKSIQVVTEEIMMRTVRHVHEETGRKYLCLAGGVALNCVANGRILREGPFEDIWIQPAAGDAGGALGAALFAWYQYLDNERHLGAEKDFQKGSYLGPGYSEDEIRTFLRDNGLVHRELEPEEVAPAVADLIVSGKVVGWFSGRMEFGPRALGARSILGDARSSHMQRTMNLKIKYRESFRPFAPTVLAERAGDYFEIDRESPYMLLVAQVHPDKCRTIDNGEKKLSGLDRLRVVRSEVPAITHVDSSARLQTVSRRDNPEYHRVIRMVEERSGCPVIINTSFNVRGEPIVCAPIDAYKCFMRTEMDFLALGRFLLDKKEQPRFHDEIDWREEYDLD